MANSVVLLLSHFDTLHFARSGNSFSRILGGLYGKIFKIRINGTHCLL